MSKSSYEEVYEIIKKHGPITLRGIGKVLVTQNRFTQEDFDSSDRCEIAGYLSCLSQNKLIEKAVDKKIKTSSIRKASNTPKVWRITKKASGC